VESVIKTLGNSEDDSSKKESLDSISQVISSYVEENKEIFDMLGNEKMSHLMKEYLNQIKDTSSTEKKSSSKTETAP